MNSPHNHQLYKHSVQTWVQYTTSATAFQLYLLWLIIEVSGGKMSLSYSKRPQPSRNQFYKENYAYHIRKNYCMMHVQIRCSLAVFYKERLASTAVSWKSSKVMHPTYFTIIASLSKYFFRRFNWWDKILS